MPRRKVSVPDVAEAGPGLWSNAIRAGDMLYISGQVSRPFEGGTVIVGKDEYEQARQIFSRIDRIIKAAGGTMDDLVKMTIYVVDIKNNTEVWRARRRRLARARRAGVDGVRQHLLSDPCLSEDEHAYRPRGRFVEAPKAFRRAAVR